MESMLGFRQDLGFAGSVESMAAISIHPVIEGSGGEGLEEAAMRSAETINLGDEFEIDAGAQQVMARFSQNSPNTILGRFAVCDRSLARRKLHGELSHGQRARRPERE